MAVASTEGDFRYFVSVVIAAADEAAVAPLSRDRSRFSILGTTTLVAIEFFVRRMSAAAVALLPFETAHRSAAGGPFVSSNVAQRVSNALMFVVLLQIALVVSHVVVSLPTLLLPVDIVDAPQRSVSGAVRSFLMTSQHVVVVVV